MGMMLDTDEPLSMELRRESVVLTQEDDDEHIFAYPAEFQGDSVEISKEYLAALVRYLDDPKNRAEVLGGLL